MRSWQPIAISGLLPYNTLQLGPGGPLRYWCTHPWSRGSKIHPKQVSTIFKKTPLKWILNCFHIKCNPLMLPKFDRFVQKHPFFLKINVFRPLNTKCTLRIQLQNRPIFMYAFFSCMCTPIYPSSPRQLGCWGGF